MTLLAQLLFSTYRVTFQARRPYILSLCVTTISMVFSYFQLNSPTSYIPTRLIF